MYFFNFLFNVTDCQLLYRTFDYFHCVMQYYYHVNTVIDIRISIVVFVELINKYIAQHPQQQPTYHQHPQHQHPPQQHQKPQQQNQGTSSNNKICMLIKNCGDVLYLTKLIS